MKRVKMDGTVKKIDWNLLVKETLDGLLISQQTLAVLCKVSQQSISNWKNRARNPGIFAKQKLYELAQKKKIDLSKYETDNVSDVITK
ncbi:MAG: hypothetical protein NT118_03130 [Lentisphaerae bacterium]|nr:hypothetical protein [Lentisphaerota bacterium]